MIYRLVILLAVAALAACNTNQDPLANQPANIRNGVPPKIGREKPTPNPLFSDSLRIDTSASDFHFNETVESTYTISGRALLASSEPQLLIENLGEFNGAKFEEATGVFTWTPPRGFASGSLTRKLNLKVNFSVLEETSKVRVVRMVEVPVFVSMKAAEPTITRVEDLAGNPIVEGQRRLFNVWVKDEDSIQSGKPQIAVLPTERSSYSNISGLIYQADMDPDQDINDKTLWKFQLAVDSTDMELTKNEETYQFRLVALSRYGVKSQPLPVNVKFRTNVTEPVSTLEDKTTLEVTANEETYFSFVAMDPKQEGKLAVTLGDLGSISGTKAYTCEPGKNLSIVHCYLKIKADESAASKTYQWTVRITNRSPVFNDSASKTLTNTYNIKVLPPKVTPPPANPNPGNPGPRPIPVNPNPPPNTPVDNQGGDQ